MDSMWPGTSPVMSRLTEDLLDASGRTQSGFTHPVPLFQLMLVLPSALSRTGEDVLRSVERRLANIGAGPHHPVQTVFLFNGTETDKNGNVLREEAPRGAETAVGYISGDRNCSDIDYVERRQGRVVPVADASQAEFPVGSCQTATAYCSSLEVPGYRYMTCTLTK